ncbi:MAG TPA: hypothetical protein VFN09_11320 [Rhodanobacteraceae bacterium]|nr:hypothetical protein [Rhodanobacteraceae bacterium]
MSHVLFLRSRSLHPLLRALLTVIGVSLLALLVFFGFVALLVMAGVGLVALLIQRWRQPQTAARATTSARPADPRVLEGDFVVVDSARQRPH